jgi:hypothetical protein
MNRQHFFQFIPRSRLVGYGILLVPVSFLGIFAMGEVLGGDVGGLTHIAQVTPLLLISLIALKRTHLAGVLLVVCSFLLGGVYFLWTGNMPMGTKILIEAILFVPSFLAGFFFIYISSS